MRQRFIGDEDAHSRRNAREATASTYPTAPVQRHDALVSFATDEEAAAKKLNFAVGAV